MSQQPELFIQPLDPIEETAQTLKEEGMNRAAKNRPEALVIARGFATKLGRLYSEVTMDDVAAWLTGDELESLGNAAGSVFKGKQWEWTGRFIQSTRLQSHGNLLRVWRWVG